MSYVVYWTVGLLYTFVDMTGYPAILKRYKIQPGTNEPVESWKLIKVWEDPQVTSVSSGTGNTNDFKVLEERSSNRLKNTSALFQNSFAIS